MMGRTLVGMAAIAAILALTQLVGAEDAKKEMKDHKGPPGPEMLFKHLDKNNDGVISEDETPKDAPEPLLSLLKTADKDSDKKVTAEEFTAAIKENPLPPPHHGPRHGGPGDRPQGDRPGPCEGMPCERPNGMMPPPGGPGMSGCPMMGPARGCPCMANCCGVPPMGFGPHRQPSPPYGRPHGKMPDPNELFTQLDTDKDGKLTQEEFTEGLKKCEPNKDDEVQEPGRGPEFWGGPHDGPGHERPIQSKLAELENRLKALETAAEVMK